MLQHHFIGAENMHPQLIEKYAKPVPRYTSYPTAPHFNTDIDNNVYKSWLGDLQKQQSLSLYVHIPFCDTLCWFCGCHTKHTLKYQPVADYLPVLMKEISAVSALAKNRPLATRLHWGGGSPTILSPEDILLLANHIKSSFDCSSDFEFSIEIDPRGISDEQLDAMAEAGLTRASIGVQDFNPHVQEKINRVQTFEETKKVVDGLRARGVKSLNLDVMYGLPNQTRKDVETTVDKVIELDPDRIAFFGYAHVPWMKKHQTMILEKSLPDTHERFIQATHAANRLLDAGYKQIGLDHFSKVDDALAVAETENKLARNFQGYTEDNADALIGFGASAIGKLPQGYVQNITATSDYMRQVEGEGVAIAKGFALSDEDRMRAHLIEKLMCDYSIDTKDLFARFGDLAKPVVSELQDLLDEDKDDFIVLDNSNYTISPKGRPYVRSIAATFDTYFASGKARHSSAV